MANYNNHFDVIVLGVGGVGSSAMLELAKRGANVLGIDRFSPGHDRGSSHGITRIIRRSYFEHPDYVPLLNVAYQLWDELSERENRRLMERTGLLYFGRESSPVIGGILNSAAQHNLQLERLPISEATKQFSAFVPPEGSTVLFEPDAGYLLVEDCVKASVRAAEQMGATLSSGEEVISWDAGSNGVRVKTAHAIYEADKLLVTAGCWASGMVNGLDVPLRVVRKHLHWFESNNSGLRQSEGCPCFFMEAFDGYFYGFPDFGGFGVKVAEHSGGLQIDDPLLDAREEEQADTDRIRGFMRKHIPSAAARRTGHAVCYYTMSPDEHFIVDIHPEYDRVAFAAGLSGHGFKFASALGKVLTEFSLDGTSKLDVDFLSLSRPSLRTES